MRLVLAITLAAVPAMAWAQNPKGATYITAEEVALINKSPGVDRQIVNVDIGKSNLAVGVIHRGRSGAPATPGAPTTPGAPATPAAPAAKPVPCGEQAATPPTGPASGIAQDGKPVTNINIS